MRIVLSARMVKMSGIGRYIDSLIPFLASNYDLALVGNPLHLEKYGKDRPLRVQIITLRQGPIRRLNSSSFP